MYSALHAVLILQRLPDLGPATYWRLLKAFSSPEMVLAQPEEVLKSFLKPRAFEALKKYRHQPLTSPIGQALERDLEWLERHPEIHLVNFDNSSYPQLLRHISKPPPLLYVRGDPGCLGMPQIAVVGSRSPTAGGSDNAKNFSRYLAEAGFAITSGMALGVDGAAHRGALAGKGTTIAVLGTGIDRIYPANHQGLAEEIIAGGGALVSEFPLNTGSLASNFPQRNRIISGISCGTVVIEAALKSGSLITARLALEQNREVFAIPGSIHNPLARGCHRLIREGAKLVETGQDIVEELGAMLAYKREELQEVSYGGTHDVDRQPPLLSDAEQILLDAMGFDPVSMDIIIMRTGMSVGAVSAHLIRLELRGIIYQNQSGYCRRA